MVKKNSKNSNRVVRNIDFSVHGFLHFLKEKVKNLHFCFKRCYREVFFRVFRELKKTQVYGVAIPLHDGKFSSAMVYQVSPEYQFFGQFSPKF